MISSKYQWCRLISIVLCVIMLATVLGGISPVKSEAYADEYDIFFYEPHHIDGIDGAFIYDLKGPYKEVKIPESIPRGGGESLPVIYVNLPDKGLTSINVEDAIYLYWLYIDGNQLTTLDVSKNLLLWELGCPNNNISKIYLPTMTTPLTTIYCSNNKLTELDVSKNIFLKYLWCDNNKLTTLNLKNNNEIDTLDCRYNYITDTSILSYLINRSRNFQVLPQYGFTSFVKKESPQVPKPAKPSKLKVKAGKEKITISWKKNKNAAGYEIEYSTKKNFKKGKKYTKKVVIKKNSTVKKTIKKLKTKKTYYIKVRAFNKDNKGKVQYGKWSKAKKLKTK